MTETDLGNITPAGSSLGERRVPDICAPGEACQKQWWAHRAEAVWWWQAQFFKTTWHLKSERKLSRISRIFCGSFLNLGVQNCLAFHELGWHCDVDHVLRHVGTYQVSQPVISPELGLHSIGFDKKTLCWHFRKIPHPSIWFQKSIRLASFQFWVLSHRSRSWVVSGWALQEQMAWESPETTNLVDPQIPNA